MAISRNRKEELVAQYVELLQQSKGYFLAEYRGIGVQQLEKLRADVREVDGAFHVTKNTLLQLALEEVGQPVPDELLTGQTATGFAMGELPALAKALVDFADEDERFALKGGAMGMTRLTPAEIEALADLPSLDELRAQIIGLINGPAQGLTTTVTNGVRQLINVVNAYAQSEDEGAEAA
ncbi:MAG: 50S ribosomal protein L10 [Candidatus Promineifilaceae bacterium]|nr:50S ribosomal protein L10 [Candidatus Promineifilaceae bacterium]